MEELMKRKTSQNEDSYDCAKEKFCAEFKRFKDLNSSKVFKYKIARLENTILETFKRFENDISQLSQQAELVVSNRDLASNLKKGRSYIKKHIELIQRKLCSDYYTINEDWHDIR